MSNRFKLKSIPDYDPDAAPEESIRVAYETTARNVYEMHSMRERVEKMAKVVEENRGSLAENRGLIQANLATIHPVLVDIEKVLIDIHRQAHRNETATNTLGERVDAVVKRVRMSQAALVAAGFFIQQLINRIPW